MVKKFLLIDDDQEDQELVVMALQELKQAPRIESALNGIEALNKLKNIDEFPDLILLDLNMPKMNGFEVLKELKMNPKFSNIPVVIFSTSTNHSHIETASDLGAAKFVTKPSLVSELARMLDSLFKTV